MYGSKLYSRNLITFQGDSGGPLTYDNKVVGLVSYGLKPCGQVGVPGVYTKLSAVRDFIDETITSHL